MLIGVYRVREGKRCMSLFCEQPRQNSGSVIGMDWRLLPLLASSSPSLHSFGRCGVIAPSGGRAQSLKPASSTRPATIKPLNNISAIKPRAIRSQILTVRHSTALRDGHKRPGAAGEGGVQAIGDAARRTTLATGQQSSAAPQLARLRTARHTSVRSRAHRPNLTDDGHDPFLRRLNG
jgi:hypothetical protein